MRLIINIARLAVNFMKGVVFSGWDTASLILRNPDTRAGITRMSYGELDSTGASLVGALVNLTPGTSTVAIDLQHREMLLHLLDLERRDETLAAIPREFIDPMLKRRGGRE